jgi:hypothetical protein
MHSRFARATVSKGKLAMQRFSYCLLAALLLVVNALAQVDGSGSIEGRVTDPLGAAVADATVTATTQWSSEWTSPPDSDRVDVSWQCAVRGIAFEPGLVGRPDLGQRGIARCANGSAKKKTIENRGPIERG